MFYRAKVYDIYSAPTPQLFFFSFRMKNSFLLLSLVFSQEENPQKKPPLYCLSSACLFPLFFDFFYLFVTSEPKEKNIHNQGSKHVVPSSTDYLHWCVYSNRLFFPYHDLWTVELIRADWSKLGTKVCNGEIATLLMRRKKHKKGYGTDVGLEII